MQKYKIMNLKEKIKNLSPQQKIAQMFIMGFSGTEINNNNKNIKIAIENGLGGVIFFAENIISNAQFKQLVNNLNSFAEIPLFMSIDQEGGLVERTILKNKKFDFLTPMALANSKSIKDIETHTQILAEELAYLGINMDFAPVLDVNTNPKNPIIGIRAFGENCEDVIKYSEPVYKTLIKNNIMPVGKHFPGHGEAWVDSHIDMPEINLSLEELENIHIKPFIKAIRNGLDALMIAHVHYKAFNKDKIPASLSKEVLTKYLKQKLNFKGLIISDDMVMGGVANSYNRLDSCIEAINSGIDIFIFRDSIQENLDLFSALEKAVKKGIISEAKIYDSVEKILKHKLKYGLFNLNLNNQEPYYIKNQEKIDKIAEKTIKIIKKGTLLPLNKYKKIIILSPDKSSVFNYKNDKNKISDFLELNEIEEINYSLNPNSQEIQEIKDKIEPFDTVIFISYNALLNENQIKLYNAVNKPHIAVAMGIPDDIIEFNKADTIINTFCYKTPSLKTLAKLLSGEITD